MLRFQEQMKLEEIATVDSHSRCHREDPNLSRRAGIAARAQGRCAVTNHDHERAIDLITRAEWKTLPPSMQPGWSRTWRSVPSVLNTPELARAPAELLRAVAVTASPALVAATQRGFARARRSCDEQRSRTVLIAISFCIGSAVVGLFGLAVVEIWRLGGATAGAAGFDGCARNFLLPGWLPAVDRRVGHDWPRFLIPYSIVRLTHGGLAQGSEGDRPMSERKSTFRRKLQHYPAGWPGGSRSSPGCWSQVICSMCLIPRWAHGDMPPMPGMVLAGSGGRAAAGRHHSDDRLRLCRRQAARA